MKPPEGVMQLHKAVDNPLIISPPPYRWLVLLFAVAFLATPLLSVDWFESIKIPFYLCGAFVLFRYSAVARSSYPVWLMLLVIVQMTFTWVSLLIDHPEIARSGPSIEDYLDKFAFLIVAIALGGRTSNLTALVFLMAALIFMIPWVLGDGLDDFFHGLSGGREGLGLNPIRTALYLSLVVLGLLAFRKRFFGMHSIVSLGALIWAALFLLCIGTLLMTQTRGVLACLLLVVFVFGLHGALKKRRVLLRNKRYTGIALLSFLLILFVGIQTDLAGKNYDKFKRELSTVQTIFEGDLDSLPNSSWGLRAQFWLVGAKWISERPFSGWGYRAGRYVLGQESKTNEKFKDYRQLHNSYLELTVRYGVGGLAIILSLFLWVLYQSHQACKRGNMSKELRNFTFTSVALFMLAANFYGLFFDDVYGLHIMTLLLGVPVSFIYKDLQAKRSESMQASSVEP